MYRRRRGLWMVLFGIVAVASTAGTGAAAAVLTAEEMGALMGGCSAQLYCKDYTCGSSSDCSQTPAGFCTPGVTCRDIETKVQQQPVETCDSPISNGDPCTRDADTPCGTLWDCHCQYSWFYSLYVCITRNQARAGTYHPCI